MQRHRCMRIAASCDFAAGKAHTCLLDGAALFMTNPAALFRFRLSGGHSIGRVELLKLWAAACRSREVAVSRVESGAGFGQLGHTYSLFGPARMGDLFDVEHRLRDSLTSALPKATFVLTRY